MMARTLLLGALTFVSSLTMAATPAPAAKPDLAKGQAISTQVCAACHTADGSRGAPANPIIAGQHPEYLLKQLQEFKSGKRKNAVMSGMVAALSEDDMRQWHVEFERLSPEKHLRFLQFLCIPEEEIRIIRDWASSQIGRAS